MSNSTHVTHSEIDKRRYASMLLLCIYTTQVSTAAIIDHLNLISIHSGVWVFIYYILTMCSAIPQSGFSDDYGRKKHLLIANIIVLVALLFLIAIYFLKNLFIFSLLGAVPSCLILGIGGNAIPIARGCLTSIKVHDFRSSIGLTSAFIGLGWVTVNLLGFILTPIQLILVAVTLQIIVVWVLRFFYNFHEEPCNIERPVFSTIFSSYKWFAKMLFVTGGAAALIAYLFTEVTFYQIYVMDELPEVVIGKKVIGVLMGIAYLSGVCMQWIVYPSDQKCIKFGAMFSLIFLFIFSTYNIFQLNTFLHLNEISDFINGFTQYLFAFGFGFFVPALFSLMSQKIHPDHSGRLFGVVDTIDTAALGISYGILIIRSSYNFNYRVFFIISLLLFVTSVILYYKFVKEFKSYEKTKN